MIVDCCFKISNPVAELFDMLLHYFYLHLCDSRTNHNEGKGRKIFEVLIV